MIKKYLKFYKPKTFKYSWRYNVTSNLYYYLTWHSSHNSIKILKLSTLLLKEKIIENIYSDTNFKNKYILQNSIENISTYLNFLKRFLKEDNERAKIVYRQIERIHSELMNTTITKKESIENNTECLSPIDILNKNNNEIVFFSNEVEDIWNLNKIEKEFYFYNHKMENKKNKKFFGWTMTITIITFVVTTIINLIYK